MPRQKKALPVAASSRPGYADGDDAFAAALEAASKAAGENVYGNRRDASAPYEGSGGVPSVRGEFDRDAYDFFRPGERIPLDDKGAQAACLSTYDIFSVVRNVIDMMSDFVVKGIDVAHPSPRVQAVGQEWWKKIKGRDASGRIATSLFLAGTAPIRRRMFTLPDATLDSLRTADPTNEKTRRGRTKIPASYEILDPLTVEEMDGPQAREAGRPVKYATREATPEPSPGAVHFAPGLNPRSKQGWQLRPLDPESHSVLHYKKPDYKPWARPMLYPMLDDLHMLTKLRQADRAALDGVISHVRVWKLGSLEHKIVPGPDAMDRLHDLLLAPASGGVLDLIWGPDIELVETSDEAYKFLGSEKYAPTIAAVYQGLGVPPALTGAGGDSGFTNNYVSLKVMIERLEYCRQILIEFWTGELEAFRRAFGFRQPFKLVFDAPSLSDDSSEKKLLIDLADRDIISTELLVERFGADPAVEEARVRRETRRRVSGQLPAKAGPYHRDSQVAADTKTAMLLDGRLLPSDLDMDLPDPEELPVLPPAGPPTKENPPGNPGRPAGSKDTVTRKKRLDGPTQSVGATAAQFAAAAAWAAAAQAAVLENTRESFLGVKGKASARALTSAEMDEFESLQLSVLLGLKPLGAMSAEAINEVLSDLPSPSDEAMSLVAAALSACPRPTIEDRRRAAAGAAAAIATLSV